MTVNTSWANDIIPAATTITSIACCECGLVFGMDVRFYRHRQKDHRLFYCPNGHPQHFTADLLDAAERRAERLTALVTHERDQRQAAERSAAAYKGVATRVKRRIAHGVCPACNRTFADVARHMEGKHPDFLSPE
jgi:hypothetical protein